MTRVHIPSPLFSYTAGRAAVDLEGRTLAEILRGLDRRFPGLRFRIVDEQDRIRPHIWIYVGESRVRSLDAPVSARDEVRIAAALSGG